MIDLGTELNPSDGLALFTDGSAYYKDGSGGWAFLVLDAFDGLYRESGSSSNTTNNQMELMGPTYGLNWVFTYLGPSEILVYSDSEYVVLGAQDPNRARNKNLTFWQTLDKAIGMHPYVEFIHVKGHADHFWNEMVDDLAGNARKKGLTLGDVQTNTMGGHRQGQPTSKQAALDNLPRSGTQRYKVLDAIRQAGRTGLTNDELAMALSLPNGASGSPGKRAAELHDMGWIKPSGETRVTRLGSQANVWILTGEAKEHFG